MSKQEKAGSPLQFILPVEPIPQEGRRGRERPWLSSRASSLSTTSPLLLADRTTITPEIPPCRPWTPDDSSRVFAGVLAAVIPAAILWGVLVVLIRRLLEVF